MRTIVIDDSRAMRAILRQSLLPFGGEVHDAANGKEALDRLDCVGPLDLALVDWNMPEMNGLEFVLAVRAQTRFAAMKIVMVTTETEAEQMMLALNAGADEYIMKPFTRETVAEKLAILGLGG